LKLCALSKEKLWF